MSARTHAVVYIDGACSRIVSGSEAKATNNRMELRVAIEGLNALEPQDVEVVVDSLYVLKG